MSSAYLNFFDPRSEKSSMGYLPNVPNEHTVTAKRNQAMMTHAEMNSASDGHKLRTLRTSKGLRQDQLAKMARVSRTSVIRAEKGDETLRPSTLMRIREALEELSSKSAPSELSDIARTVEVLDEAMASDEPIDPEYYEFAGYLERLPREERPRALRLLVRLMKERERAPERPEKPS